MSQNWTSRKLGLPGTTATTSDHAGWVAMLVIACLFFGVFLVGWVATVLYSYCADDEFFGDGDIELDYQKMQDTGQYESPRTSDNDRVVFYTDEGHQM